MSLCSLQKHLFASCIGIGVLFVGLGLCDLPPNYKGLPFRNQIQKIPGIMYPWRYDSAGAEISWHTSMTNNQGDYHGRTTAGKEDPIGLKRLNTAWDHMASGAANDTMIHYNDSNNVYLGYVVNGEWQKMTMNVLQTGTYQIDAMVTACCQPNSTTECLDPICDPTARIDFLNGTDSVSTGLFTFVRTGYYHTYMYEANVARLSLKQGIQVHRLQVVGQPPFNMWYFKYTLVSTPVTKRQRFYGDGGSLKTECISRLADGALRIDFQAAGSSAVTVECFNCRGNLLASRVITGVKNGANRCTLTGHFAAGAQIVRLVQGAGSSASTLVAAAR